MSRYRAQPEWGNDYCLITDLEKASRIELDQHGNECIEVILKRVETFHLKDPHNIGLHQRSFGQDWDCVVIIQSLGFT